MPKIWFPRPDDFSCLSLTTLDLLDLVSENFTGYTMDRGRTFNTLTKISCVLALSSAVVAATSEQCTSVLYDSHWKKSTWNDPG